MSNNNNKQIDIIQSKITVLADGKMECETGFFVVEMLTYAPAFILFVTGTLHFYRIRSIGFNRVV